MVASYTVEISGRVARHYCVIIQASKASLPPSLPPSPPSLPSIFPTIDYCCPSAKPSPPPPPPSQATNGTCRSIYNPTLRAHSIVWCSRSSAITMAPCSQALPSLREKVPYCSLEPFGLVNPRSDQARTSFPRSSLSAPRLSKSLIKTLVTGRRGT